VVQGQSKQKIIKTLISIKEAGSDGMCLSSQLHGRP
jgi:hypothetical protein